MEGPEQIEQGPHLPLFAHSISVNAVWALADPCGECLFFFASLCHRHHILTSRPYPSSQSPLVLEYLFAGSLPLGTVCVWTERREDG